MNICIFSTHYGGGYGTGYSIKKEAEEFVNLGHKVFVIHSEKNINNYIDERIKFKYFSLSMLPIFNIFFIQRKVCRIIAQVIENYSVDVFYVQSLEFGLVKRLLIQKIPVVYFARSTVLGIEKNKPKEYWIDIVHRQLIVPILVFLERRCLNDCQRIIVKSKHMRDELVELYDIPYSKIEVISGGQSDVDFPYIEQHEITLIKQELGITKQESVILFTGRIVPVKGIQFLLLAFADLVKKIPNVKLIIVGASIKSHHYQYINQLTRSLKLQNHVLFTGYVLPGSVYKYFNISDVIVVPSTYEPFGMALIQAVMFNKPLISTDCCGALELIRDYPLLITIPSFSSIDITNALLGVLSKKNTEVGLPYQLKIKKWNEIARNLLEVFSVLSISITRD